MNFDEIERILADGFRVGFAKPTDSSDYLGWILVSKVKPNKRILEVMLEDEAPELVKEERRRETQPYLILRIELKRSVHEAGDYETEADYRQKERYWFSSLDEVEEQLKGWGYSLEQAKEARNLDAP